MSATSIRQTGCAIALLALLAACSGGGGGGGGMTTAPMTPAPVPVGTTITTPGVADYVTDHNGFTRARISSSTPADMAILQQFDDANPANPAGYRNLIALTEKRYTDNMQLEVIAEVASAAGGGEQVVRVLRLTADQAPFKNLDSNNNLIAKGEFFFRGSAEVYAMVDGGALQRGIGDLENMVVNFDTQTVSINLRTPFNPAAGSGIETEMVAANIPLNVVTGSFGGPVALQTRSATTGEVLTSTGTLRGNLNGDEAGLSRLVENMTTSGLFSVGQTGERMTAQGIFWGSQLNYGQ
ncbi:viral aspartic protease [Pseudooceanicola sp. 216_PA32_1]|uniref:Viral aspartic protease n=1 Tax=Pseudooceanicola pacificus TaxID=2676438 RepID=A0A844W4I9_9RHOB|nr:viral aspartic protease [Pseudooceanicola pacificus]MWB78757.1 viral aspartic protease [Pseudooceanicola pacificus]